MPRAAGDAARRFDAAIPQLIRAGMTTLTAGRSKRASLFEALTLQAPDALLAIIGMHRADPRPEKIDLGVGVYRDEAGRTPIMRAVKAAEARLLADQPSKGYSEHRATSATRNCARRSFIEAVVPHLSG